MTQLLNAVVDVHDVMRCCVEVRAKVAAKRLGLGLPSVKGENNSMKNSFSRFLSFVVFVGLLFAYPASQAIESSFVYHQLAMKDLDEMTAYVKEQIKASKGESADRIEVLRKTLFTIFARPDEDGMIDKIIGPLRSEIDEHATWELLIRDVATSATRLLMDPQSAKGPEQVTNAIVLQNVIAMLKPAGRRKGWERNVLSKIAEAEIKLTKASRDERKLRLMKDTQSPSTMADQVLGPAKDVESQNEDEE